MRRVLAMVKVEALWSYKSEVAFECRPRDGWIRLLWYLFVLFHCTLFVSVHWLFSFLFHWGDRGCCMLLCEQLHRAWMPSGSEIQQPHSCIISSLCHCPGSQHSELGCCSPWGSTVVLRLEPLAHLMHFHSSVSALAEEPAIRRLWHYLAILHPGKKPSEPS